jgi:hypothetical protein
VSNKQFKKLNYFMLVLILVAPMLYKPLSLNGYNMLSSVVTLFLIILMGLCCLYHYWKFDKSNKFFIYGCVTITAFLLMVIISEHSLSFRYLILYYIFFLFYLIKYIKIDLTSLVKITNYTYLLFIFLSALTYFGIISINKINIFEYSFFNVDFKTFIGLYGSTANLDSYSLLVAVINFFFNKDTRYRRIIIAISIFVSFGTLRFTPILSLILAGIFSIYFYRNYLNKWKYKYDFIRNLIKVAVIFICINIFLIFGLLSYIDTMTETLGSFTSGRNKIWALMIEKYANFGLNPNVFLGYGTTSDFSVKPFGYFQPETINPHNNYLRYLIEYGIVFMSFSFFFILRKLYNMKKFSSLLILFFILLIANTNNEIFDIVTPVYLIWTFGVIYISENEEVI